MQLSMLNPNGHKNGPPVAFLKATDDTRMVPLSQSQRPPTSSAPLTGCQAPAPSKPMQSAASVISASGSGQLAQDLPQQPNHATHLMPITGAVTSKRGQSDMSGPHQERPDVQGPLLTGPDAAAAAETGESAAKRQRHDPPTRDCNSLSRSTKHGQSGRACPEPSAARIIQSATACQGLQCSQEGTELGDMPGNDGCRPASASGKSASPAGPSDPEQIAQTAPCSIRTAVGQQPKPEQGGLSQGPGTGKDTLAAPQPRLLSGASRAPAEILPSTGLKPDSQGTQPYDWSQLRDGV